MKSLPSLQGWPSGRHARPSPPPPPPPLASAGGVGALCLPLPWEATALGSLGCCNKNTLEYVAHKQHFLLRVPESGTSKFKALADSVSNEGWLSGS